MRHTVFLLMLLTGVAYSQWRHFDRQQASIVQSSLPHDMLGIHNAVRARVGVTPLTWSDRLAASSQKWADTLLARRQFAHSPNAKYGENLFEIRGAPASFSQVVRAWAREARDYDYESNRCRDVCGHYTQLVWSGTREVGCAVARGGRREVWVCEYDPPGNYVGQRPY